MDTIIKSAIALAVIIVSAFVLYFAFSVKKYINTKLLLKNQVRSDKLVYRLLEANYNSKNLLRNPIFPSNLSPNAKLFRLNAIHVNHGGVLLITVRNMKGMMENPFQGDWRQFYNNSVKQLANPLELNADYSNSIRLLLKAMKVENVPINSIVIYLDGQCKFKNKIDKIVLIDRLIPYIHDMNKEHFLTGHEIRKTVNALREMSRKPQTPKQPTQYRSNYPDKRQ